MAQHSVVQEPLALTQHEDQACRSAKALITAPLVSARGFCTGAGEGPGAEAGAAGGHAEGGAAAPGRAQALQ